ncbi:MAG: tandem-95 repeat protein [Aestuariibacter sp.]
MSKGLVKARFLTVLIVFVIPQLLATRLYASDLEWSSEQYIPLYEDFNNNGRTDLLLISNYAGHPSLLVPDDGSDPIESWIWVDQDKVSVIAGDFDNDGRVEVMALNQQMEGLLYVIDEEGQLAESEERLKIKGYNENRQINFTHLFKGDFNNDQSADLLAYAQSTHDIVVFHNKNSEKKVKFKFKDQLSFDNSSPLTPLIRDFNDDGNDDIALLSYDSNGSSYVSFANRKGRFKRSEFEDIQPYLNGESLNLSDYSIVNWRDANTDKETLLRLKNADWGVDEEGNKIDNEGNPYQKSDNFKGLSSAAQCEHLAYSPIDKQTYLTCGPWDEATSENAGKSISPMMGTLSDCQVHRAPGKVGAQSAECQDPTIHPPNNPSSYPSVGSYQPVGRNYSVSVPSVSNATYYKIYEQIGSGSNLIVSSGSSQSYTASAKSSYGYVYYKYKACNIAGCSAYSPRKRIYVYQAPGGANNVSLSKSSTYTGSSATLSWTKAGGIISSGYYIISEVSPSGSSRQLGTKSAGSSSSYTYSVSPYNQPGTYTYKVQACNPNGVGCGGSRQATIYLNNRNPSADNESTSVNEGSTKTIYVLPGDSDPDGHSISITGWTQPTRGSVSCNSSTCSFSASSNISYDVGDSFTYTISDGYGGTDSATVSVTINNLSEGTVSKPVISPTGRTFDGSQSVSISTATSGAKIYYTTNGSNPSIQSSLYSAPFNISSDTTVKAIGIKNDYSDSAIDTEYFDRNYQPVANNDSFSVSEDGSKTVNVIANDTDADGDKLYVSSVSTASNGAVTKSGDNITYTPNTNFCGNDSFTYFASDGRLTEPATVSVTVSCVNDTPTMSAISNMVINEDTNTGSISFAIGDVETSAGSLSLSAASSNTAMLPVSNITFGGSGSNRTVKATPKANYNGTAYITVYVTDGLATASRQFKLTVNAVNDVPTISTIPNKTINEDSSTGNISFTIWDAETSVTTLNVSASSNNQTLVSTGNISLSGTSGSRSIKVTPKANHSGTATITVTVSDGVHTASESFVLTVNPVNDPPSVSGIANQSIIEDSTTGNIGFTIADEETSAGSLSVSATSSNQTLLPDNRIALGGSGANRTVKLTPTLNQYGSANVTVTVSDGGHARSTNFTLEVSGVNDAPAISSASPSNNSFYKSTQSVTASASASDIDSNISQIEFRLGSGAWQIDTSSPFSHDFGVQPAGSHTISFRARDTAGAYSTVVTRSVKVGSKPVVAFSEPSNNHTYKSTEASVITATASDADGAINRVEFKLDSGEWLIDTSSPYTKSFGVLAHGAHTMSIRALDDQGEYSPVITRNFTVNQLPTLQVSSPTAGKTFKSTEQVVVNATASDSAGLSRVEFRLDGGAWLLDTTSPYSKDFGLLTSGVHTVEIRAQDSHGEYSGTETRSFSVNQLPTVSDASPANNVVLKSTDNLVTSATASDSGPVTQIEFRLNDGAWQVDNSSPYGMNFGQQLAGSYRIDYRVKDHMGEYSPITSHTVHVNQMPVITTATPNNNANFGSEESVTATATVSDTGPISQVEFRLNSGVWQADSSSPYSFAFGALPSGSHTVSYRAKDASNEYSAVVSRSFKVDTANLPPTANNTAVSTPEDSGVAIALVANDENGDTLTYSHTQPANGTLTGTAPNLTYTPSSNYYGTDSFTFKANDGVADSGIATVTITVTSVNDEPTGNVMMSGTAMVGNSLSASNTLDDADGMGTVTYQWQRNSVDITGATGADYEIVAGDTGAQLRVKASYTDGDSTSETQYSTASAAVQPRTTPDWAKKGGSAAAAPYTALTANDSTFNGAIPGEAGVSGGAAAYNIPIVVPPGRNGMQPNVSINYSSRSGLGIAGVGWSLSAGSSISRCPRTVAQDGVSGGIEFNLNDRLCLDGQRLVVINNSGTYGAAGTTYTTEIDSFITVTQTGSLDGTGVSFSVQMPNGAVKTYGNRAQSRVIPTNKSQALSWLLDQETDVAGNYMEYHYVDKTHGEVLLERITYTGYGTDKGDRHVEFGYENAGHYSTQYLAGGKTRTTQRLKTITTQYGASAVRTYSLNYALSQSSGRPLLSSVQECAPNTAGICRELTAFTWADDFPTIVTEILTTSDGTEIYPKESYTATNGSTQYKPVSLRNMEMHYDVDGNGVRDWIYHRYGPSEPLDKITYVNAEGDALNTFEHEFPKSCSSNPWTYQEICVSADFNVDGRTDVVKVEGNVVQIGKVVDYNHIIWRDTGITLGANGEHAQVVNAQDYTGDGLPDLIIKQGDGSSYHLNLYTQDSPESSGGSSSFFSGAYTNLYFIQGQRDRQGLVTFDTDFQFVGDMNADGLGDFVIYGQVAQRYLPTMIDLLLTKKQGNSVVLDEHDVFFNANDTVSSSNEVASDGFSYTARSARDYTAFIDVNGDGLSDWVGFKGRNGNLIAKLNMGNGQFGDDINLGVTFPERLIWMPDSSWEEPEYGAEPRFKDAFQQVDIDGDGKSELLMPDYIVAEACVTFMEWATTTSWVERTRCGADIEDSYKNGQYSITTLGSEINRNVYQFKALKFVEDENGVISGQFITKTEQPNMNLQGTIATNFMVDAFGKGLSDMIFTYGCERGGCAINDSTAPAPYTNNEYKAFVSRNYGSTDKSDPGRADYVPIDMLVKVENGVGKEAKWDYSPLSSHEFGSDYYDPIRTDFETDPEHFNFASSMYTVASFKQSDGIGGLNETQYQYAGAVYNVQGRGFRGFKTITELDLSNDTSTHTVFKQKFPFSSLVAHQSVFAGTDITLKNCGIPVSLNDVSALKAAASASCPLISQTENDWQELTSRDVSNAWVLFNAGSHSLTYDISSYGWVSHQQSTVLEANVDRFGNVEQQSMSITDSFGTHSTTQYGDFSQATRDWARRYESKAVVKHAVSRTSGITAISAGTDNDKVVKTTVDWDLAVRKPNVVTVYHGESSGTGNDSTATTKATETTTTYNDYGLPTKVDVKGNVLTGTTSTSKTRTVNTNYSKDGTTLAADGYFPFEITQAYGHKTTTKTNPETGLPKEVTDVTGVITSTTYDKLARPIQIARTGFPAQFIEYHTPDTDAPSNAVMYIQTRQAGVPTSKEYKDVLGRTLRTATQQFSGNNYIFQDVTYNTRGLTATESAPYQEGGTKHNTQYVSYDELGRLTQKITPQTNGSLTTNYTYEGLKTDIKVTPTVGQILTMSREYSVLEQLMRTTDAIGGVTEYAYDGSGNPIVIEDAKNNQIVARYDALGRKAWVDDPNQGKTEFTYNDFGELEREKDANGDNIYYDMDLLGRVTSRSGDNGAAASFLWDTEKEGLLTKQSITGHSTEYTYDSAARVTTSTVTIDGDMYVTETAYDSNYGRPTLMTYPKLGSATEALKIEYRYNSNGYLTHERNASSKHVYREITAQDVFGNITGADINAGGITGEYTYHGATGQMLSTMVEASPTDIVQYIHYSQYDSYGNLTQQENLSDYKVGTTNDIYQYDKLHRLTQSTITVNGASDTIYYGYDAVGNMLKKSDHSANSTGAYQYSSGSNKLASILLKSAETDVFTYDNKGNQTLIKRGAETVSSVTYNVFNKPTTIDKNGANINLSYGADLMRYKQVRGGEGEAVTTFYIGKLVEVEQRASGNTYKSYISDIAILTEKDGQGVEIAFTHRDRLGSATSMTDENDKLISTRHFDPFGKPRSSDWDQLESFGLPAQLGSFDSEMATRRGFTDHEHLDEAELIHMNGRVYDYNVGRFMSVDPFIQGEGNSQGINPYSYVMNNPLGGIDPTGYKIEEETKEIKKTRAGSRIKTTVGTKTTTTVTDDNSGDVTSVTSVTVMKDGSFSGAHISVSNGKADEVTVFGGNSNGSFSHTTDIGAQSKLPNESGGTGNKFKKPVNGGGLLGTLTNLADDIDNLAFQVGDFVATSMAGTGVPDSPEELAEVGNQAAEMIRVGHSGKGNILSYEAAWFLYKFAPHNFKDIIVDGREIPDMLGMAAPWPLDNTKVHGHISLDSNGRLKSGMYDFYPIQMQASFWNLQRVIRNKLNRVAIEQHGVGKPFNIKYSYDDKDFE